MKESDISKNIPSHRKHQHEITAPDGHSKEDHKHPSSGYENEIEHKQHKKGHQPKRRSTTMRGKIAASIIGLLTIIGFSPVIEVNAAGIKSQKILDIQTSVIDFSKAIDIKRNVIGSAIEIVEISTIANDVKNIIDYKQTDKVINLSIAEKGISFEGKLIAINNINIGIRDGIKDEILVA
jgi:hypothetical protein